MQRFFCLLSNDSTKDSRIDSLSEAEVQRAEPEPGWVPEGHGVVQRVKVCCLHCLRPAGTDPTLPQQW